MTKYIKYGFVDKNSKIYDDPFDKTWDENCYEKCVVQDKDGILKTGYGTCRDQVELGRDWFKSHNFKFVTIFVWFEEPEPSIFPTHSYLAYTQNDKWYHFENSDEVNRGIIEYISFIDMVNDSVLKLLELAISQNVASTKDISRITYHIYQQPPKDCSVDTFIQNATK